MCIPEGSNASKAQNPYAKTFAIRLREVNRKSGGKKIGTNSWGVCPLTSL